MQVSKKIVSKLLVVILALSSLIVLGQQPKRALTNDDIIRMVKEGLPDNVIISTIQQFPANYDISPDALIQMKRQGVSGIVLTAMQEAEKVKNSKQTEVTASSESKVQQKRVSKISNDFVFELNVCQSSGGDSVTCWFFITNKAQERKLYIDLASHIDDDLGERYSATDVWIANKRREYTFETSVSDTLIPGNPTKAILKFQNVKPEAKLIRVLRIVCSLGEDKFNVDLLNIPITPKPQSSPVPSVEQRQEKQSGVEGRSPVRIIRESNRTPPTRVTAIVNPESGLVSYEFPFKYRVTHFSLDVRQRLDLCAGTITVGKDSLEIRTDSNKSQLGYDCNSTTYRLAKDDIQKLKDTLNSKWYEFKPTTDHVFIKFAVVENNGKDKKKKEFYLYPAEASIKYGTRTHTLTGRVLVCPECPAIVCRGCEGKLEMMKNLLGEFYGERKPIL